MPLIPFAKGGTEGDFELLTGQYSPAVSLRWIAFYDGDSGKRVRSSPEQLHGARDSQKIRAVGCMPGSSSSDPAGMMARWRSRLRRGTGEPHARQTVVAKLFALGRSNRIV